MKKKNNSRFFWIPFYTLLIIYIGYSLALESGYYQTKVSQKTVLTEEKIEEFENDVKNGEEIDIKKYTVSDYKDYSSPISKTGQTISLGIENFMTKGIGNIINIVSKLFTWYNLISERRPFYGKY